MSSSPRREPTFDGRQPSALSNALAILDVVASRPPGITAREVVEELDMPRATAYRILNHLVAEEYLVRSPDLRGFAFGKRMRELGRNVARQESGDAADECGQRPKGAGW
ncbi:hypothetical protein BH09ACT12_BH09ACT12_01280 [soil metagenome]